MMDPVPNQSITAWPWPDELDAVSAAPDSHRILLENAHVRVLEIVIPPGHREPMHTHRWPSVMLIDVSAAIRYYQADGQTSDYTRRAANAQLPHIGWLEAEGLHAVENRDSLAYHAIRIEIKGR